MVSVSPESYVDRWHVVSTPSVLGYVRVGSVYGLFLQSPLWVGSEYGLYSPGSSFGGFSVWSLLSRFFCRRNLLSTVLCWWVLHVDTSATLKNHL